MSLALLPVTFSVLLRFATTGIATLGALVALAVARPVQAQHERIHTHLLVAGGLSFAGGDSATTADAGLAGLVGLQHQRARLAFLARAGTNYGGSAPVNIPGGLRDRFDELALLAGYAVHRSEKSQVLLMAGIATVSGERVGTGPYRGPANVPFKSRAGVPLQMTISAPGGGSGFGLTAHADLNREQVFGAVTVTYLIGLDRPRRSTSIKIANRSSQSRGVP